MNEIMVVDLVGCARCGEEHLQLEFAVLTRPMQMADGSPVTHWASCPTTGQPVMMRITDVPEGESAALDLHK